MGSHVSRAEGPKEDRNSVKLSYSLIVIVIVTS